MITPQTAYIGQAFYTQFTTKNAAGTPTDPDASPAAAFSVYEQGQGNDTPLVTGTPYLKNPTGTAGLCELTFTPTKAQGFEKGKEYFIFVTVSVDAQADQSIVCYFRIGGQQSEVVTISGGITIADVKSHLLGLETWLSRADECAGYDDARIAKNLVGRIREFERMIQFRVNAVQVVTEKDGTYVEEGATRNLDDTLEVFQDSPMPYYSDDSIEFFKVRLREKPVQTVQRIRLKIASQTLMEIPPDWFVFDQNSGKVWLHPYSGSVSIQGTYIAFATIQLSFGNRRAVPALIHADYIAGLPDGWEELNEWQDLRIALEEWCAIQVLGDISELYDAGLLSKSVSGEGFQQTLNFSRFQKRIENLTNKVMRFADDFKAQTTGILLDSL